MELFASRNHHFNVGDRIMVVGPEENVNRVAQLMGNSEKRLNAPNIATIFIGIIVGILFGSLPIAIPQMPVPLKLGLAGGPLIIAILIGRFGYRMHLVDGVSALPRLCWYQGRRRILGDSGTRRWSEVCIYRLPHHDYPYINRRNNSPNKV